MHSTRIATFLLGAWIGGCIFLDLLAVENLRLANRVVNSAIQPAAQIIQKDGRQEMALLLRYFAAEQYRWYFSAWEKIQIPGALLVAGVLYFSTGKRLMPQILCGLMLALVLFQLAIHPELAYRGRAADFPPGSQSLGTAARMWALIEVWGGAEGAKLLSGAVLASYLFTYKSRRRSQRAGDRSNHAADAQGFVNQRQ
jgi:hypothetical protein